MRRTFLSIIVGTWAADAAADVTGSRLGGPPLPPWVNSHKVYSAYAASIGAAALARWAIHRYAPVSPVGAVATGALAALGDMTESAIKRRAGVKDSGNLIPGYGGVLDRLDSTIVNLVVQRPRAPRVRTSSTRTTKSEW